MSVGPAAEPRDGSGAYSHPAVTVFVLLLLLGSVGAQTRDSLPRMALSQIEQASERRARTEAEVAVPAEPPVGHDGIPTPGRTVVETRFRVDDWWPAPRGPDSSAS